MQRIFAPLLLSLPLIFGCIPDLPDLYDENFTCQWDDDCQQEDETYFVCHKWLEGLAQSGYGDNLTDYNTGICAQADAYHECAEDNHCDADKICYRPNETQKCLNPCDAGGEDFCQRYGNGLQCVFDRNFSGGFVCSGCQKNAECPDNHRCAAQKNSDDPGICIPACDNVEDGERGCQTYSLEQNGTCLVFKGKSEETIHGCGPCDASGPYDTPGVGGYFNDTLGCNTGNTQGSECDYDGTCEGHEQQCGDCVVGCDNDSHCDEHEYCDDINSDGHALCVCECNATDYSCDLLEDDPCPCDADCNPAMQDCLGDSQYGNWACVLINTDDENGPKGGNLAPCENTGSPCNNDNGYCASVVLAEEWFVPALESKASSNVCVACPDECPGDCIYDGLDGGLPHDSCQSAVYCPDTPCASHDDCDNDDGLESCTTLDGAAHCMFMPCNDDTNCDSENERCVDYDGSGDRRCVSRCNDGTGIVSPGDPDYEDYDFVGEDCSLLDDSTGTCNWVTNYDGDGNTTSKLVCIPCDCDNGCECADGECTTTSQYYQEALTCSAECAHHNDCFTNDEICNKCIDGQCVYHETSDCSEEEGCLFIDTPPGEWRCIECLGGGDCSFCLDNDDCQEGSVCDTDTLSVTFNQCIKTCETYSDCASSDSCYACNDGICEDLEDYPCNPIQPVCLYDGESSCFECLEDSDCGENEGCGIGNKCRVLCANHSECDNDGQCITYSANYEHQGFCHDVNELCSSNDVGEGGCMDKDDNQTACVNVFGVDVNNDDSVTRDDGLIALCLYCKEDRANCDGAYLCTAKIDAADGENYFADDRVGCNEFRFREDKLEGETWCADNADNDDDGAFDCDDPDCGAECCKGCDDDCNETCDSETPYCLVASNENPGECVECIAPDNSPCTEPHTFCSEQNACECDALSCTASVGGAHCDDDNADCTTSCDDDSNCNEPWACEDNECIHNHGDTCSTSTECTSQNCLDVGTGTNICCEEASCELNETCASGDCQGLAGATCSDGDYCTDGLFCTDDTCCQEDSCNSGENCANGAGLCLLNNAQECSAAAECSNGICESGSCGRNDGQDCNDDANACANFCVSTPGFGDGSTCCAESCSANGMVCANENGYCLIANGQSCDDAAACNSGECADDTCCDTACEGDGMSCALFLTEGTCTCDETLCVNETGRRAYHCSTTNTCTESCAGDGDCPSNYTCATGNVCRGTTGSASCDDDADCSSDFCSNGTCQMNLAGETNCSDGIDNDTDNMPDCADPECYDSACDGADGSKRCAQTDEGSGAYTCINTCDHNSSSCLDGYRCAAGTCDNTANACLLGAETCSDANAANRCLWTGDDTYSCSDVCGEREGQEPHIDEECNAGYFCDGEDGADYQCEAQANTGAVCDEDDQCISGLCDNDICAACTPFRLDNGLHLANGSVGIGNWEAMGNSACGVGEFPTIPSGTPNIAIDPSGFHWAAWINESEYMNLEYFDSNGGWSTLDTQGDHPGEGKPYGEPQVKALAITPDGASSAFDGILSAWTVQNGRCSVTTTTSCLSKADCNGEETCVFGDYDVGMQLYYSDGGAPWTAITWLGIVSTSIELSDLNLFVDNDGTIVVTWVEKEDSLTPKSKIHMRTLKALSENERDTNCSGETCHHYEYCYDAATDYCTPRAFTHYLPIEIDADTDLSQPSAGLALSDPTNPSSAKHIYVAYEESPWTTGGTSVSTPTIHVLRRGSDCDGSDNDDQDGDNAICDNNETPESCPSDCHFPCDNDGVCEPGESNSNCYGDCFSPGSSTACTEIATCQPNATCDLSGGPDNETCVPTINCNGDNVCDIGEYNHSENKPCDDCQNDRWVSAGQVSLDTTPTTIDANVSSGLGASQNAASWENLGPVLAVGNAGRPMVSFGSIKDGGTHKVHYREMDASDEWPGEAAGGEYKPLPVTATGDVDATSVRMVRDACGNPIVVWAGEDSGAQTVYLRRQNDSTWEDYGREGESGGSPTGSTVEALTLDGDWANEPTITIGPRDDNQVQRLCIAWRTELANTQPIYMACRDHTPPGAATGTYCCPLAEDIADGTTDADGFCPLKADNAACTFDYECDGAESTCDAAGYCDYIDP